MSLFKIFKGSQKDLESLTNTTEGYAYYTDDDSHLYIDTATTGKDGVPFDETKRRKVIGLSQVNKHFENLEFKTLELTLPIISQDMTEEQKIRELNFFKPEGYTYIVAPLEDSYDTYVEAGIRASKIEQRTDGGYITLSCKELPKKPISISVLRIEEDPYVEV